MITGIVGAALALGLFIWAILVLLSPPTYDNKIEGRSESRNSEDRRN